MKKIANIQLHPTVLIPKKGHPLYIDEVKTWLETNSILANNLARLARKKEKGALAKSLIHEGYVREIKHYLRHGDWISNFYGEYQEFTTKWRMII
tara:strand:- start:106 stop:390 length:285 start_codon:yes stop_codon:yes gene_type:complete